MNGAHLHLLINHLPIIGSLLSIPLLALVLLRPGDTGVLQAAVLVLVLSGLGAIGADLTGDEAHETVENLPGFDMALIHEHEERAEVALAVSILTALAGVGLIVLGRRRAVDPPRNWLVGLLILALVSAALVSWTGAAGGVIRHSEIRADAGAD